MNVRRMFLLAAVAPLFAGCAARTSTAYIEVENDQNGLGRRAEPVLVDPRVDIVQNEYRRSSVNDGSNILQKIRIRGPIMIVPAPVAATQPAPVR